MEKTLSISFEQFQHWNELSDQEQFLVQKANEVCGNAYAPYSKFNVGASVLLGNGEIVTGSNQENVAYPSGLCAERVALFYCGANYPNEVVKTICIVAKGDLLPKSHQLSPCGACRQVMLETENRQNESYRVILVNQDDTTTVFHAAKDLLPLAFGLSDK